MSRHRFSRTDLAGDIIVGEEKEPGHRVGKRDTRKPLITKRRPDGHVVQDHRRHRGLDALGEPEFFDRWRQHNRTAKRASEHPARIVEIARTARLAALEEGPLNGNETSVIVERSDHGWPKIDVIAAAQRRPRMKAERRRQDRYTPTPQIKLGDRPGDRPRSVPDLKGTQPAGEIAT